MIRKLIGLVVVAAALWSGYWFIGATASKSATAQWLEDRRVEGWQVEYSDLSVRGFPNRFDTTITDVQLTDPDTGLSWSAPFFQIFALSYKPNHLIAIWPDTQTLATPFQKIDIATTQMRASLVVKAKASLELARANLVMEGASFDSSEGWAAGFDDLKAAIHEREDAAKSYDLGVEANALIPGDKLGGFIDQGGTLPDKIEGVRLDAVVATAEPIDRRVIEDARPDITAISLNEARGAWGELELRAAGDVTVDAAGQPTGDLSLNVRQWREMLQLAVNAGAIAPEMAKTAEFGLKLLASASGNSDSLDAPLSFSNGRTFLGPIPIGKAPVINLR